MVKPLEIVKDLECLWAGGAVCGEGLCWEEAEQALYWVDIDGCRAHRYRLNGGAIDSWDLPERPAGYCRARRTANGLGAVSPASI